MIIGVTSLAGEIYVLRWKGHGEIKVYDVTTDRLQRVLPVPNAQRLTDMTSCEHPFCVYISDHAAESVHRLDIQGVATRWKVNDQPWSLSVNGSHNLLVTCPQVRKIKEFSSSGAILREVQLPADVVNPSHALQLTTGQFIVCHGRDDATVKRVCMISEDGRETLHSHAGQPGSSQNHVPRRLGVDNHGFVFVADIGNRQVTLLSPTLEFVRDVVSSDKLKGQPRRLCLDIQNRQLYVADVESSGGNFTSGRVVVFRI